MKYPIDFDKFYKHEPHIFPSSPTSVKCKVCETSAQKPEEVKHKEWCPVGQMISSMEVQIKNVHASLRGTKVVAKTLEQLQQKLEEMANNPYSDTFANPLYELEFNLVIPFDYAEQQKYLKDLRQKNLSARQVSRENEYKKELASLEKKKAEYTKLGYSKQLNKINKKYGK